MGETFSIPGLLILLLLSLVRSSQATNTVVMDSLAEGKGPTVHVGDSLVSVFKHKHHLQNLYLFHNKRAFDLCIFSQATLIYDGSKSTQFTWHPDRPGYYYFIQHSSRTSCEKLRVRIITPDLSPGFPPKLVAPPTTAGGDLPSHGWAIISSPSSTPTPAPDAASSSSSSSGPLEPRNGHAPSPDSGDGGTPFINSNPAVPLPAGETDSATILPLPSPGDSNQVVGKGSILRTGTFVLVFVMIPSFGLAVETYFPFGFLCRPQAG